jgi:pyridinium-3,5-biscarboxylic acid mononucleotide synthase
VNDPFAAIREALSALDDEAPDAGVRVDPGRWERTGIPEVIYAGGKTDEMLATACRHLLQHTQRVIVSRITSERAEWLAAHVDVEARAEFPFGGSTTVIAVGSSAPPVETARIAIFTAGTADLGVAGEAATVARELGCHVEIIADVGVAGLHRLVRPLARVLRGGVDAIIVAAGMDGALPSVIAGLVDVPVIGLPTSTGYGVAAGGHAALTTMLASCSPGLTVVNIDNGVGAGAAAARIAVRSTRRRQEEP